MKNTYVGSMERFPGSATNRAFCISGPPYLPKRLQVDRLLISEVIDDSVSCTSICSEENLGDGRWEKPLHLLARGFPETLAAIVEMRKILSLDYLDELQTTGIFLWR